MKKIKQTYFSHDSNARNDIKLIRLRSKYGYEGYGIYFALIELLFSEGNYIEINDFETLAFGLQCDSKKLKNIIHDFDLFVIKKDCFYSKRLDSVINEIESKSKKASDNAKKRWDMQPHSDRNAIKLNEIKQNKIKSNDILLRLETFQKKVFNIKDIDLEDKKAFIDYWTEPNKSGSKLRFEMEKTWDLKRRLKRWVNSNFNQNKKEKYLDYFDEYIYKKLDSIKRKEYEEHLKSLGWICKYSPSAGMVWTQVKKT